MKPSEQIKNQIELSGINNYGINSDMLFDYLHDQIYSLSKKLEKINTAKNWRTKRDVSLKGLEYCLGLKNLPERTSTKARTVGKIKKDSYLIEKIIFESFENIFVPAHLYIPQKERSPAPAILHVPGHWMENSKMEPDIQKCCIGLTELGFVVLVIDPFEQGERRIDWKTHGHLQTLLVGITQMGMMVYENLKAIDYLQSRDEIDNERIGMMGASGGGGNTIYTTPFDQRIKAAIPVCAAVTYPGLIEGHKGYNWDGAVDLCNQVPRVINTLSFSNLLALNAPRPTMIISAEEDINFPLLTANEVFQKTKPFFDIYGPDLFKQTIVTGGHGLSQEARESVYGFFYKHLMNKGNGSPIPEKEIEIEEPPY
ncbi:MAG: acetylxylan esterase, partial [Candidatus Humimicrobiaceae bacterium]